MNVLDGAVEAAVGEADRDGVAFLAAFDGGQADSRGVGDEGKAAAQDFRRVGGGEPGLEHAELCFGVCETAPRSREQRVARGAKAQFHGTYPGSI